jgi:hypothetical protein
MTRLPRNARYPACHPDPFDKPILSETKWSRKTQDRLHEGSIKQSLGTHHVNTDHTLQNQGLMDSSLRAGQVE